MRLRYVLFGFFLIVLVGVCGYHFIEGFGLLDSLYMSVITITTVGYREVKPLSQVGKVFTVFYIFGSLGYISYAFFSLGERFFEETFRNISLRRRRGKLKGLENHFIVCGYGRIGHFVVRELEKSGESFVVVDNNPEVLEDLKEKGIPFVEGDAREEEVLLRAGIKNARAIACLLETDADNLYVVFTAKDLNKNIFVVSRAEDILGYKRLLKAGADKVVLPYEEGGMKIAYTLLRPSLLEFFELAVQRELIPLELDQVRVDGSMDFCGKRLRDSNIRGRYGVMVIAIKRGEETHFNPDPDMVIEEGDVLILMGEREGFERLSRDGIPLGSEEVKARF